MLLGMKIISSIVAGAISISVLAYTGSALVQGIKDNTTKLEDRIQITADEGARKIDIGNKVISAKNTEIGRLGTGIDSLVAELDKANAQITEGNNRLTDANNKIAQANADMADVNSFIGQVVTNMDTDQISAAIVDTSSEYLVGEALTITIVQNQDTSASRTLTIANPNGVPVTVSITSNARSAFEVIVPAGDVIYLDKNNSGEMLTFKYTVPGTGEAKTSLK